MTYLKYRVRVIRYRTEQGTAYDFYKEMSKDIICTKIEVKDNCIVFYDNDKMLAIYPTKNTVVNKI